MEYIPKFPWTGGIDRRQPSSLSDPNTAWDLKNILISSRGSKVIRGGVRSYWVTASGAPIGCNGSEGVDIDAYNGVRLILPYIYGNDYRLLCIIKDGMYFRSLSGFSRVGNSISIVRATQGLQFGKNVFFVVERDTSNAVGRSAGTSMYYWDAVGDVQPVNGAPSCSYMRTHYNRLIVAGDNNNPMIWSASGPVDAFNWTPGSSQETIDGGSYSAELPGSQPITAISPSHYTGFYISTKSSLHLIQGRAPSEYAHSLVSNGMGNFGHNTLINLGGTIIGWNNHSCYSLTDTDRGGGVAPMDIGQPINSVFLEKAKAVPDQYVSVDDYANGNYITFMPHLQHADWTVAMVYSYRKNQWTWLEFKFKISSAIMWNYGHRAMLLLGNDTCLLLCIQPGQLSDLANTDYESSIDVNIESHNFIIGNEDANGSIQSINVTCRPNITKTLPIRYTLEGPNYRSTVFNTVVSTNNIDLDALDADFALGSSSLQSSRNMVTSKVLTGGDGRNCKLQIKGTAEELGNLELYGLSVGGAIGGAVK